MKITSQKLPKNLIELTVELSPEELAPFLDQTIEQLNQETEIPGFRPGKIPIEVLKREVGEIRIYEKAAEMAIGEKYPEIIDKEKIESAGPPKIEIQKLAPANPLIFKLTIPLLPKVKLGQYQKIKVEKKPVSVPEETIQKTLDDLRKARAKEMVVERKIQIGDRIELDLEMFLDGISIENGQAKNVSMIVGEDFYLPELSEQLIGLKRNEVKEFVLNYPENFYDQKLAGRPVRFKIKINNIYQRELPEVNDLFAQGFGPFQTLAEFKNQIRENMEKELTFQEEERFELEILRQLVEQSEFEEIPEILLEREAEKMLAELEEFVIRQNLKIEDYLAHLKKTTEDLKQEFLPRAEERVKTALAIREVGQQEKIEIDQDELNKEHEKLLSFYKDSPEIQERMKTDEYKEYLRNVIINRKVIEWLKKQIT